MNINRFINPILMWVLIVVGGVILYYLLPAKKMIDLGSFRVMILILNFAYWVYMIINGLKVYRHPVASVEETHEIITSGVYRLARHPLYGAHLLLIWAGGLFFGSIESLAIAVWATIIIVKWAKLEEQGLSIKFGKKYLDYKNKTPMFFPWEYSI